MQLPGAVLESGGAPAPSAGRVLTCTAVPQENETLGAASEFKKSAKIKYFADQELFLLVKTVHKAVWEHVCHFSITRIEHALIFLVCLTLVMLLLMVCN